MTHSQFVAYLIQVVGGSLTSQRAIETTNRVQNEIAQKAPGLFKVSPDPFLATTTGIYSYAASTSIYASSGGTQGALVGDIMFVSRIYAYNRNSYNLWSYRNSVLNNRPPYIDQPGISGLNRFPADIIPSRRPNGSDCLIEFWPEYNPGTTTTNFRLTAYAWPTQVTTASTTLYIGVPEHMQHTLLLYGCLRDLNIKDYQDLGNPGALFETEILKAKSWTTRFRTSEPSTTPLRW